MPLKSTPRDTQRLCEQAVMEYLKHSSRTHEVREGERRGKTRGEKLRVEDKAAGSKCQ